MSDDLSSPRFLWLSGVAVLLALALRLYQLNADSLWEDEIFTATQSIRPLGELLNWTAGDVHPPGYYLAIGRLASWSGWDQLPPTALTDWLWRFLSVIAGTLAVAVTARLGADWMGRPTGLIGAWLLAVSPVALQYSQEARMHQLFLLGAAVSSWVLWRAMARPARARWWLAYALLTAVNLYTAYLAFAVLAVQGVWVAAATLTRRSQHSRPTVLASSHGLVARWLLSSGAALIVYLPWWPVVLNQASRRLALSGSPGLPDAPLAFAAKAVYALGPGKGYAVWVFLALWLLGWLGLARRQPAAAVFGLAWLILPLALPFVFQDPRFWHMRYAFILSVYLLGIAMGTRTLAAWLAARLPHARFGVRHLGYGALAAGALLMSVLNLPAIYRQTKPDWRGAAAYLAAHSVPGDAIVTDALFDTRRYLDYYYEGPAELVTPAVLVASLPQRAAAMRASGGRVWAVTRFTPAPKAAVRSVELAGLVISEPTLPIYEPEVLTAGMIDLAQQTVAAASDWAARMAAEGVMEPDARVARAAAYLFLGEVYQAAGQPQQAIAAYQAMIAETPDTAAGYVRLAEAYQSAGQLEAAAHAYRHAVLREPIWQGSQADKAEALVAAGRWADAVQAYQAIVHQP